MLDTNTASQAIRANPGVLARLVATPLSDLRLSAVTEAELGFGLARRPEAHRLRRAAHEFLARVETLALDGAAAERYGTLRADLEARGQWLGALDMLIAAHALSVGDILVSADKAFRQVPGLVLECWETG